MSFKHAYANAVHLYITPTIPLFVTLPLPILCSPVSSFSVIIEVLYVSYSHTFPEITVCPLKMDIFPFRNLLFAKIRGEMMYDPENHQKQSNAERCCHREI